MTKKQIEKLKKLGWEINATPSEFLGLSPEEAGRVHKIIKDRKKK